MILFKLARTEHSDDVEHIVHAWLSFRGVRYRPIASPRFIVNTLRPRRNRRRFADDIFKCIFLNENLWISIRISWKFVPRGPINNTPALVQIMAWRRSGDKPLFAPMVVSLPTHLCVTGPQWVINRQWKIIRLHAPLLLACINYNPSMDK